VPAEKRESIFNDLVANGIGVQVNYIPAYWHPVFEKLGHKRGEFPISDNFYNSEISIPMHFGLGENDVKKIISILFKVIQN
jgi:dTDP-4-amino-4,6-dideoxygalactose transaminase